MKTITITKYETNDGIIFDTEKEATEHENDVFFAGVRMYDKRGKLTASVDKAFYVHMRDSFINAFIDRCIEEDTYYDGLERVPEVATAFAPMNDAWEWWVFNDGDMAFHPISNHAIEFFRNLDSTEI